MRISIITPSFRQLDWLRLCVASVRDQVLSTSDPGNPDLLSVDQEFSIEHIIQDGGSSGLEEFAREVGAELHVDGQLVEAQPDPAVPSRYRARIYRAKDSGMYDAVNQGLRKATGEILCYLNCDEQYLPGTLSAVLAHLKIHPEAQVVFGGVVAVDPEGFPLSSRLVVKPQAMHTLVSGSLATFTAATFFRRELLTRHSLYFDDRWKAAGDADWILRLLATGAEMQVLDRPLATFTLTGANLGDQSPAALRERTALFQSAPRWARIFRSLVVAHYRLRKLWAGHYGQKPFAYSIYTAQSPAQRRTFDFQRPTARWRKNPA